MNDGNPSLGTYFNRLSNEDIEQLEERKQRYEDQLNDQGYSVSIAKGENNFFAGVLVIDEEGGRFGFLEPDGSVSWISGGEIGGIGAIGSAIVQDHTDALETSVEGLENANVE